jgi:butyryl-CoA dehydrogenase
MVMKQGKAAMLYMQEIKKTIVRAVSYEALKPYASRLEDEIKRVQQVTGHLLGVAAEGDPERFLADATLYLEMFGIVSVAWQWLKQGIIAQKALIVGGLSNDDTDFYEGKILAMQYYFHYEVPKTLALATRLTDTTLLTIAPEKEILV